jgi:tRNA nucleotidyltransferase (CCA-adding enzyme)
VIFTIIPELKVTDGFDQKNPYHNNTLYNHIVNVCGNVYSKANATVNKIVLTRTAALLHDVAKPLCLTLDDNGIGHFYGHAEKGALIALEVMKRLRYSNDEIEKIQYLIMKHDATINLTKKSVRKNLSSTPNQDEELFAMLLELINADRLDHTSYELMNIEEIKNIVKQIKEDNECIKLADLSVNGYDLIELGLSGKEIGSTLNYLLELVMDDKINNNKEEMLELISRKKLKIAHE